MKLSRSEINVLFKALQDGYRNYDELKIMVRLKLGENLAKIVGDDPLDNVIFALIEWVESRDRILDLVWGANERNPDNDQIKKVSYGLFGITQAQWEKLCELLAEINPTDLEFACQESFKPKKILEVDSRLVDLKSLDREEIHDILKENLIKKREKSLRTVPVVLEFADCLSGILDVGMNTIRNDLKRWVTEVNNQLSKLGKKNGSYRKMNTNLQDFGQRAILDSDVTPIRNFGPHLQEVKNQEFPSNNEQKEYLLSRRRLGMGLTDDQKQYFYGEIQRVFPDEEYLKIIFIDNEGKFGKNFYNDIDGKNYRNKLTFLTRKLQNKDFLYSFIEVVKNQYPNFAQHLIEPESQPKTNLDPLKNLLKQKKWIEADIETRKLLIDSIGNPKFVNEENFQNIKCDLLRGIDKLWREESKGRFGFSVQKEIWENINNRYSSFKKQRLIINRFGAEVGWYDNDIDEWLDVPKTNQDIECKTEGFWPTPPPSIISVDTIGKDLIPCLMKKLESCDFP